jgi:RNA polymerase sigma factor (sigma-70 family)
MNPRPDDPFATTRWTVVLRAGGEAGREREESLATLCRDYWRPVFAYVHRRGHDLEAARDLTQEFFARLLEKEWLAGLRREGGRFRGFLQTAVKRFLTNEAEFRTAAKRGGGLVPVPLDWAEAAELPGREETPEEAFDRRWALTVINRAAERLRNEAASSGRARIFETLSEHLAEDPPTGAYERLGAALGMTRGTVAMQVHRLRARWRELIRLEVADTLAERKEVDEEMRELMAALRRTRP